MMKKNNRPDVEYLNQRLSFDETKGRFWWKYSELMPRPWNRKMAGKEAFTTQHSKGYLIGGIDNKKYYAHDVAWAMAKGEWYYDDIDHINGIKTDNSISNLRATDRSGNMRNQKLRKDNSSGIVGVVWNKNLNKWSAQIQIKNKNIHLGVYASIDGAAKARKLAEKKYQFSERHGTVPEVAGALHIYNPEQVEVIDG